MNERKKAVKNKGTPLHSIRAHRPLWSPPSHPTVLPMSLAVPIQLSSLPGLSLRLRHAHPHAHRSSHGGESGRCPRRRRAATTITTARFASDDSAGRGGGRGKPPVPASQPPPLYVKRTLRGGQIIRHPGTVIVRPRPPPPPPPPPPPLHTPTSRASPRAARVVCRVPTPSCWFFSLLFLYFHFVHIFFSFSTLFFQLTPILPSSVHTPHRSVTGLGRRESGQRGDRGRGRVRVGLAVRGRDGGLRGR